jgi:hypothetical protein
MDTRAKADNVTTPQDAGETVVRTPVEVRPGKPGKPVLWVLVISIFLVVMGLGYTLISA